MSFQKIRVTKKFTFDMAHALYRHDGLCKNIHGHTYKLYITLLGNILNDHGNPKDGMVIDFYDLKAIVYNKILLIYDHALILNAHSPHAELKDLTNNFEKIVFLEKQPTCENLVVDIVNRLMKSLPSQVVLHHVKLMETPTSSAEWFRSDNQ